MAVLMANGDAEDALFGQHLRPIGAGHRLALIGRHLVDALRRHRAAGAECADIVGHAPDAVLVGHQETVVAPGEAIGPVEVLDMAIDPFGPAFSVVAQQRQIARTLLGHQHVAIGQHEQAPRIGQPRGERRRGEPRRNLRDLPVIGHDQRPVGHHRWGLWRRQVGGIDLEAPADLVLGREILRELVLRRLLRGGRRNRKCTGGEHRQRRQTYAGVFRHSCSLPQAREGQRATRSRQRSTGVDRLILSAARA